MTAVASAQLELMVRSDLTVQVRDGQPQNSEISRNVVARRVH